MKKIIVAGITLVFAISGIADAAITLTNGQVRTASAGARTFQTYQISVPSGQSLLIIKTYGGSGDPSLYVKAGTVVSTTGYTYKSTNSGTTDTITITNPTAGIWAIGIYGYSSYSSVNITAQYAAATTLSNNQTVTSRSGKASSKVFYKIAVPSGTYRFVVKTSGGSGNLDFYTKLNALPSLTDYTYRASLSGNTQTWTASSPAGGTYYIMLYGAAAYSGASLQVYYNWSKTLTAAATTLIQTTGQIVTALAFSDGSLEFRDLSGKLITSRTGLGTITAMNAYRGSDMLPKLFVASAINSGMLRVINPASPSTDIMSKSNLGTILFIEPTDTAVFVASAAGSGSLIKLNNTTLSISGTKTGLGTIVGIGEVHGATPGFYVASTTGISGTILKVNPDSLVSQGTITISGDIYTTASADISGNDGQDEVIVASSTGSGTIYKINYTGSIKSVVKTPVGEVSCLAGGPVGIDQTLAPDDCSIAYANSGTVTLINAVSGTVLKTRTGFTNVACMTVKDFYDTEVGALGIISTDGGLAAVHITNENLTDLTAGVAK